MCVQNAQNQNVHRIKHEINTKSMQLKASKSENENKIYPQILHKIYNSVRSTNEIYVFF